MFTDRILQDCMSSPDKLLLIEPEKFQPSRSSEREGVLGRAANSHTIQRSYLETGWKSKNRKSDLG